MTKQPESPFLSSYIAKELLAKAQGTYLSEEEYAALGSPETDTTYFIYED